jgi:biopolymer transport protein ExbB
MPFRTLFLALALTLPAVAQAWWNAEWTTRARIVLDTTEAGARTTEPLSNVPLAVRLHSGNFDFIAAKPDASDLRVLAGDDRTPLAFRIERFDAVNELAVLWVLLPAVAPGSDANVVHVYAGNEQAAAEPVTATGLDGAVLAALHFSAADGADAAGAIRPAQAPTLEANGLLAGALRSTGTAQQWPASDRVRAAAGGAYTVSLWFRADAAPAAGTLFAQGPLALVLEGGKLIARISNQTVAGTDVAPGTWHHAALTLGGGRAQLFLDGAPVAQAESATPLVEGPLRLGDGFSGQLDELQIAGATRSPAWLALAAATQGVGAKGLSGRIEREGEGEAGEGGQGGGYMGILVANLTIDAWVVIVILAIMFVIACWVMVDKSIFVTRADADNQRFLERFRAATDDLLHLGGSDASHPRSPLFRLYQAGVRELAKRNVGEPGAQPLSGASLDAVKAAVDADMVRESHRLNSQMVLLTIAISGGPFLGLLGTVVGVMITFAAIAAAGDVNVNAIAPGIAAALLATVAGLAVAIPALFGYNWLASKIKNVSADMQIFVDEFVTRVAERYGAR